MNGANTSVFLNILLYLIYVLVPLIPAFIIYKNFPTTKVSTSGVLGALSINTTGAFAAYVIVVTMGYFIIQNTQKHIDASNFDNSAWFVKSEIVFLEKRGDKYVKCSRITEDSLRMKLDVKATPDYSQKNFSEVSFPMYYKDGYSRISFAYPHFESQVKTLYKDSVRFDYDKRTIHLGKVELREIKQSYDQEGTIQANSSNRFPTIPTFTNNE